ncbi:hypothetical protein [[Eubacterium] hominis]|uniref:hypothetical protein n=1 Tax=[Eubacterium] hominis TaxID=2764325 RepID=UPI003A4D2907
MNDKTSEVSNLMTKKEFDSARKFINRYSQYTLEDIQQSPVVRNKFEKWQIREELSKLDYYHRGIQRSDSFIQITLVDLVNALDQNPKLKEYVFSYAQSNLVENSLDDKFNTIWAIKNSDIDFLQECDTEVRENFCKSFLGGIKSMRTELREKNKELSTPQKKDVSR